MSAPTSTGPGSEPRALLRPAAGEVRLAARLPAQRLSRSMWGVFAGGDGALVLFLGVGLVGLGVDAAIFSVCHGAGLSRAAARAISLPSATGVTYGLNRSFTFAAKSRGTARELGRYALVTLVAQGLSYTIFLGLSAAAPAWPAVAALVAGAALATAFSFTGQRLFTFRGA